MTMKRFALAAAALLVSSISAVNVSAQQVSDVQIASEIGRQINRSTHFTIFDDVNGSVDNGVVTLTGKVTMPYKKNDIGQARRSGVDGVRRSAQPHRRPAGVDVGRRAARVASRGRSTATRRSGSTRAMANPPIHIIVENGRVTLTGVVNSNVERMLARSLATGFGEFSVTNALRTDGEVRSH